MKPLLIGQAPGPNTDSRLPLYPIPSTSTGGRLAKFMGLTRTQYLRTFDRVNVLQDFPGKCKRDDKFPMRDAIIAARAMRPLLAGREVILVGRNVANAFGYYEIPFHHWMSDDRSGFMVCCIPHPSGRNLWYNLAENREAAAEFWRRYLAKKMQIPLAQEGGSTQAELVAAQ